MSKLNESVLVLNRGYTAIHVISAKKAFTLLYTNDAEVIGDDFGSYSFELWCQMSMKDLPSSKYEHVCTSSLSIRIPHVIRLLNYDGLPQKDVIFSRKNIYLRDGYKCQYCNVHCSYGMITFDHIVPKSKGGTDGWDNIVTACLKCNVKKGNRTPLEANMPLIKRPSKPRWVSYIKVPMSSIKQFKLDIWKEFMNKPYWCVE